MKLYPNAITDTEHDDLLLQIRLALRNKTQKKRDERNRILRYGWDYEKPQIWHGAPPGWALLGGGMEYYLRFRPDNITINEYLKGQVIYPHQDSEVFGDIGILSLGGKATMRFTKADAEPLDFELPPKSLAIMSGELRHRWKHETLPLQDAVRYSIVYRKKI